MCHAFLDIYTCTDIDCRSELESLGLTGSGFAFQDMACAVEQASRDSSFLNLKVRLNRGASLDKELNASGVRGNVPQHLEDKWFPNRASWKEDEGSRDMDYNLKGLHTGTSSASRIRN